MHATHPTSPLAVASASPTAPIFDGDLARAWVAQNYSDESKRLVTEGSEATPEDQAKYSRAYAAGLFSRATTAARTVSPATVLAATAEAFRSGAITWGQDFFTTPTGCRCVLGGLAWAIDPATFTGPSDLTDPAGRLAAEQAMDLLAELLVDAYGAPDVGEWGYYGTWCRNPIEVVGDWNDAPDRTLDDVLELLDDAAARAARTAAAR